MKWIEGAFSFLPLANANSVCMRSPSQRTAESIKPVDSEQKKKRPIVFLERGGVWASALNLTKATIGSGVLVLPYHTRQVGIPLMTFLLILGAVMTHMTVLMLGRACEAAPDRGYDDIASQLYGHWFAVFVVIAMFANCFGAAAGYVVSIGDALKWTDYQTWKLSLIISSVVLLPLACIYRINTLRYFSMIGVCGVGVLVTSTIYCLCRGGLDTSIQNEKTGVVQMTQFSGVINAFSSIVFAYVCHYNVPHLYGELKEKSEKTLRSVSICSLAMSFSMYLIAGVCGYLAFGFDVKESILKELQPYIKERDVFVIISVIGCVASICVAHSLHVYPIRVSAEYISSRINPNLKGSYLLTVIVGISVVYLSLAVALLLPSIKTIIDVVGASASSAIAFIFPPLFSIRMAKKDQSSIRSLWQEYTILSVGIIMGSVGTFFAIEGSVTYFKNRAS